MSIIRNTAYRVFQFCFYKAARFLYWPVPVRLQGPGSVQKLPDEVKRQGVQNVLFVTDRSIIALHLCDPLLQALKEAGIAVTMFDSVMPNPTIEMIETARSTYEGNGCGGFIAFGGGSVIDTAKAAAARIAKPRKTIAQMGGFLKVGVKLPPVFAVPTTAGTGSEVTVAAVVTEGDTHHKYAVNDPRLIPCCAVHDPCLIEKLPPAITADTGMDALTHAVEAYITWGVSKKCRKFSEDAVRLIFEYLPRAYQNGSDMEARMNMLTASFYAGDSFTRAGLTYVHAIAHTLSGLYGTPHGRANAVILPIVLRFYGSCVHKKLARLAVIAGLNVKGKSEAEAAGMFIEAVRDMNRSMNIPETFDFIKEQDIPRMVKWALAEANPWYPVPKIFGAAELTAAIRQVQRRQIMKTSEIVAAQKAFFDTGKTLDLKFRRDALSALLNAIIAQEDKLLSALHEDLGKSACEGYMTEVGMCRDEIRFLIKHLSRWIRPRTVATPLAQFAAKSFIWPEPFGNALIISPWNYPVLLSIDPLAGAIAAGNTVVLKPSNYSKATSQALFEIISGIFPPEYVSVVLGGRAENTDLLAQKFDYIFFTGSVSVGKTVMEAASKNLTPVSLELGGKSPVIIDETADIALAAKRIAFGKFINAGQTCVAPDYVLVHESKKDALIEALRKAIQKFYPGGIEDENLPHIISEKHFDRITALMAGENAVIGGLADKARLRIAPTVLDGVTQSSPVMGEEIFGPILPILAFANIEEAIKAVKARPKPLALYLFTQDKALQRRVLREVSFGGGCLNDTIIHLATPHMGFGGVGESGMGAYHGKLSFDTFTHYKSIVDKKTWMDLPVRYAPFTAAKDKMLRMFLK